MNVSDIFPEIHIPNNLNYRPFCVCVFDLISLVLCTDKIKYCMNMNVIESKGGFLKTKEWISSCSHKSLPFQSAQGSYTGLLVSSLLCFFLVTVEIG